MVELAWRLVHFNALSEQLVHHLGCCERVVLLGRDDERDW